MDLNPDKHMFVVKLEFAGKGVQLSLHASEIRSAADRHRLFDEAVRQLLYAHGVTIQ